MRFASERPSSRPPARSPHALTAAVAPLGRSHSSGPRSLLVYPAPRPPRPRAAPRAPHVAPGPDPQHHLAAGPPSPANRSQRSCSARLRCPIRGCEGPWLRLRRGPGWLRLVAPPPRSHPVPPSSGSRHSPHGTWSAKVPISMQVPAPLDCSLTTQFHTFTRRWQRTWWHVFPSRGGIHWAAHLGSSTER